MPARDPDENGWVSSASAWISRSATGGDFARQHVLDKPMLDRVKRAGPQKALDIGCGEGRFSRMMGELGITTTGLDPVPAMLAAARAGDPGGEYVEGFAEHLPFDDASFDLIVSYLALIDIDDAEAAIHEMARVLRPGGRILVANLSSFATSSAIAGRRICKTTGEELRPLGHYMQPGKIWFEWDGLRIRNWHRPLSTYMKSFLDCGLQLTHFDEPLPHDCTEAEFAKYQAMPFLMIMEWQRITSG